MIDSVLLPDELPQSVGRLLIGINPGSVKSSFRKSLGLEEGQGIAVHGLTSNSGAREAGIRRGDVILTINGKTASSKVLDEAKNRKTGLDAKLAPSPPVW